MPGGMPKRGDCVRRHQRPQRPCRQVEGDSAELRSPHRPEHPAAHNLLGPAEEPASRFGTVRGARVEMYGPPPSRGRDNLPSPESLPGGKGIEREYRWTTEVRVGSLASARINQFANTRHR